MYLPCGKCLSCKQARANEWTARLIHERPFWKAAFFVTLTYSDEHLPSGNTLVKEHLQDYIKRYRRSIEPGRCKHFSAGEYGETSGRAHYHAIILTDDPQVQFIERAWPFGLTYVGTVTPESTRYVANYVQKKYSDELNEKIYGGRQPPFQLQSQGIGLRYAEENLLLLSTQGRVSVGGTRQTVPRYYAKKLGLDMAEITKEKRQETTEKREKHWRSKGIADDQMFNEVKKNDRQRDIDARTKLNLFRS